MISNLQTIYPVSVLLQKHIYCYYIIENTGAHFKSDHYSFPNTLNAVSLYSNGTPVVSDLKINVIGDDHFEPFTILQGKNQNPLLVQLAGSFSRITILFKPLGLNHFIKQPLDKLMGKNPGRFTEWHSASYDDLQKQLFAGGDIKDRLGLLEDFLVSIYHPIDLPELQSALVYLTDLETEDL